MKRKSLLLIGVIVFAVLLIRLSFFKIGENQSAVTSLFGKVLYEVNGEGPVTDENRKSGVFLKMPFFQKVITFDRRIRVKNLEKRERLTADEKNVNLTISLGWKITKPKKFFETSNSYTDLENKLEQVVDASLSKLVGKYSFNEFFHADEKKNIFQEIEGEFKNEINSEKDGVGRFGVKVVLVKLTHVGFPANALPTILERMKEERNKEAAAFHAAGENESKMIKDSAISQKEKKLAEARSASKMAKSEAQKTLTEYYEVLAKDADLATFLRRMDALKKGFEGEGKKRMILDPTEFFEQFKNDIVDEVK